MSRALSFALFFLVALSLVGLAHYYVWTRLVRDPGLGPTPTRVLTAVILGLYLSIPTAFFLARVLGDTPLRITTWVAFTWLGTILLLLVVLMPLDLARGLFRVGASAFTDPGPKDPERRLVLARLLAASAALITAALGLAAVRSGLASVAVREVRVRLARLPSELDGVTLVQLTDMHIGPMIQRAFVERIVRSTNQLNPDVIVITGDLVDGSVQDLREHVAPLGQLRARYGVFFVTGNHEYYSGADEWCEELGRLGIRVLRNERVSIGLGDASFDLAGIDDHQGRQYGGGADLARALKGRDMSRELVLLAHQPRAVFEAQQSGVGLQLSGHTHGGQIWPWNFLVRLQQPVVSGLARFGETVIYVSNGTGYWGPPMRLGAPAEITRVVLLAPEEALA